LGHHDEEIPFDVFVLISMGPQPSLVGEHPLSAGEAEEPVVVVRGDQPDAVRLGVGFNPVGEIQILL